jgi:hypothetical protein
MDASPAAASHQVKGQMRHAPVTLSGAVCEQQAGQQRQRTVPDAVVPGWKRSRRSQRLTTLDWTTSHAHLTGS